MRTTSVRAWRQPFVMASRMLISLRSLPDACIKSATVSREISVIRIPQ
ncbi:MAG: hypothetical protein V4646_06815 [Pseudomonadota bacterium]